jgi:hypothetical protein
VALEDSVDERGDLLLLADVALVRLNPLPLSESDGLVGRRPQITTWAPSPASSSALARPRPDPPPLTIATCPSRSPG